MRNEKLNEVIISDNLLSKVKKYNKPGGWESKDACVKDFKKEMKQKLFINQEKRCAYCGLPLETRNPEIDHIAPKGGLERQKYYEVTFLPLNLVYACNNCNCSCKRQTDTVQSKNNSDDYKLWTFKIVHPYLDDPRDFFEVPQDDSVIVLPKKDASEEVKEKANFTISLFKLNSEQMLSEQAKEKLKEKYTEEMRRMVENISTYHCFS